MHFSDLLIGISYVSDRFMVFFFEKGSVRKLQTWYEINRKLYQPIFILLRKTGGKILALAG
jgi:hypothetical protein